MRSRVASLLLVVSAAAPAWAATYRVGPAREFKTLNAVAARLAAGDVVEVDGGHAYAGQITFRASGTSERPIVIRGIDSGSGRPRLSGSDVAGGSVVRFWGDHYVFENFEISAGRDRLTGRGLHIVANGIIIRDCAVHDIAGHGIHGSDRAGSLTLDGVEVHRCGAGTQAHQIYVATDNERWPDAVFRMQGCHVHDGLGGNNVKSRAARSEIYYNWIEGAAYHELDLIGADPRAQRPGSAGAVREDADVVGNVLRKVAKGTGSFARLGTDTTGGSDGRYRFFHNTFVVDPGFAGTATVFAVNPAVQTLEVFNNVIHSPVARLRVLGGALDANRTTGANNWICARAVALPSAWSGTIRGGDPGFRDAAALDFAPRADAPIVDAGVAATRSPAGFEFPNPLPAPLWHPRTPSAAPEPRPNDGAPDIGAFERAAPSR